MRLFICQIVRSAALNSRMADRPLAWSSSETEDGARENVALDFARPAEDRRSAGV